MFPQKVEKFRSILPGVLYTTYPIINPLYPEDASSAKVILERQAKTRGKRICTPVQIANFFSSKFPGGESKIILHFARFLFSEQGRPIETKNYTDYSPERLKDVYEKADLKVLE